MAKPNQTTGSTWHPTTCSSSTACAVPRPTPAGAGIVPFEQGFPEIGTAGSPGSSVPLAVDHQQQDRYGGARSVTGGGSTARLAAAVGGNRLRPAHRVHVRNTGLATAARTSHFSYLPREPPVSYPLPPADA
jgi:hypothetical protein